MLFEKPDLDMDTWSDPKQTKLTERGSGCVPDQIPPTPIRRMNTLQKLSRELTLCTHKKMTEFLKIKKKRKEKKALMFSQFYSTPLFTLMIRILDEK